MGQKATVRRHDARLRNAKNRFETMLFSFELPSLVANIGGDASNLEALL